jgi:hypothetical protein
MRITAEDYGLWSKRAGKMKRCLTSYTGLRLAFDITSGHHWIPPAFAGHWAETRRIRLCRNSRKCYHSVMPAKAGIQNLLKILDSVSRFACTE